MSVHRIMQRFITMTRLQEVHPHFENNNLPQSQDIFYQVPSDHNDPKFRRKKWRGVLFLHLTGGSSWDNEGVMCIGESAHGWLMLTNENDVSCNMTAVKFYSGPAITAPSIVENCQFYTTNYRMGSNWLDTTDTFRTFLYPSDGKIKWIKCSAF